MKSRHQQQNRFQTSKKVLFYDRLMNRVIKFGGIGIIIAVLGIFVFIVAQVGPLFLGARVERSHNLKLQAQNYAFLGLDEWGERPFLVTNSGALIFLDLNKPGQAPESIHPFQSREDLQVLQYNSEKQSLLYANEAGEFAFATIHYEPKFQDEIRQIEYEIKTTPFFSLSEGGKIQTADFGIGEDSQLVAAIVEQDGIRKVQAARLAKEDTLLGEAELTLAEKYDLGTSIQGTPERIRVNETAEILLVSTAQGDIYYFKHNGESLQLMQNFQPFSGEGEKGVSSVDFLLGGVSVYLTNPQGKNVLFSLYMPEGKDVRLFGKTKTFSDLPGPATSFSKSLRNKAFLVGSEKQASLRHGTTESLRWEETFPETVHLTALSKKYHRLALLGQNNQLQIYTLDDPHPEGGWKAFFGKVWYEGGQKPEYVWQSTGGSDAFEPKLSLVPLIVGTLKGTFFALLFAIPIALLAAVYTSQFLDPNLKKVLKPVMEIMASLPSVILGFLAALWLAPLIENAVPSIILVILVIPIAAILFGVLWSRLPKRIRAKIPEGREWLAFIPLLLVVSWCAWELGPQLEKLAFVTLDPSTGEQVADFRLWWTGLTGTNFEQRNSLVVGFIMGFAVIPIIFTISEDSLSAVPNSLRSASLALGASRWQTAFRVILPAATAGIFSAIMIGFGRAVGETMIVLMATGNTPLLDFNIFTGMRTLSANLAVELPEAPLHSTLYRTLFLGSLVLFLMTFGVNSIAELMRQRIRRKFKGL